MLTRPKLQFICYCIILQTSIVPLFSQSNDYINGKVINSATKTPVPFATIKLKNNKIGVYANADGDFKISSNPLFQSDSLIISCIGYKRSAVSFKLLITSEVNKIYLAPSVYGLSEVKVVAARRKLTSVTIISRAIRNIKDNYPQKPFSYVAYYRDYQKNKGNYINLNEAIIQTADNGFNTESLSDEYRLLDFKKNQEFPRMELSPYYDSVAYRVGQNSNKYIPMATLGDANGNELFILLVHDAIRNYNKRTFSFVNIFSEDFIYNHNFSEPVKVLNNNLLLYKIIFNGKTRKVPNDLVISGAIYVQPRDYSIHKLEYSCSYLTKEKGLKNMFNIDIEYGYENLVDGLMCLKYISFNNIFNVIDKSDSSFFKIHDSYWDNNKFWDPATKSKPTLIIEFNNKIDPASTTRKDNYDIMVGKTKAKVLSTSVYGNKLKIVLKDENFRNSRDSCLVNINNIKDVDGNVMGIRKSIELYQYRELFVEEYNKILPFTDSCYLKYLPLEQNCISKYSGNFNYWMNTPENIKIIK